MPKTRKPSATETGDLAAVGILESQNEKLENLSPIDREFHFSTTFLPKRKSKLMRSPSCLCVPVRLSVSLCVWPNYQLLKQLLDFYDIL